MRKRITLLYDNTIMPTHAHSAYATALHMYNTWLAAWHNEKFASMYTARRGIHALLSPWLTSYSWLCCACLQAWDRDMMAVDNFYNFLGNSHQWVTHIDDEKQVCIHAWRKDEIIWPLPVCFACARTCSGCTCMHACPDLSSYILPITSWVSMQ